VAYGSRIHAVLTVVGALAILALVGCQPAATSSSAASASGSAGAATTIAVVGDTPVIGASDLGDGHYSYTLSAAYFVADGVRHAYVVGFAQASGDEEVFHATSPDGLAWEIDDDLPFAELGLELSPPGPIPGSVIQGDDGIWIMYLWGVPAPQSAGAVIYRATASSPAGPWVADPEPVLLLGEAGAWDSAGIDFPAVLPTSDGYLMLYGGQNNTDTTSIGVATSEDGITWEKDPEPVLEADSCGKPGAQYAALPRLMPADDGYLLLFDQDRETAMATSPDGHAWTCAGPTPLLVAQDVPDGQGIHTFAATDVDGTVSVLLESLIEGASEIWLGELQTTE